MNIQIQSVKYGIVKYLFQNSEYAMDVSMQNIKAVTGNVYHRFADVKMPDIKSTIIHLHESKSNRVDRFKNI
jgi:hypothetical protein